MLKPVSLGATLLTLLGVTLFWALPRRESPAAPRLMPRTPRGPAVEEHKTDSLAELREEVQVLRRTVDRLSQADVAVTPPRAAALPPKAVLEGAAAVADLLSLDEGRRVLFEDVYERFREKVRSIEASRSTLRKEGPATVIFIPAFAEEGRRLAREWREQVDGLLSPREKEKYLRYDMESTLLGPGRLEPGAAERTVTVTISGGHATVSETGSGGQGARFSSSSSGPEAAVLAPYRHLLGR